MNKTYLFQGYNAARKETTTFVDSTKGTLARGERRREQAGEAGSSLVHHVGRPCRLGFYAGRDCRSNCDNNRAGLSLALQTDEVYGFRDGVMSSNGHRARSGDVGGKRLCNGVCDSGIGRGRRDYGRSTRSVDNNGLVRDGNRLQPRLSEASNCESDLVFLHTSAFEIKGLTKV
jgi:hypothetical protein